VTRAAFTNLAKAALYGAPGERRPDRSYECEIADS